MKILHRVIDMYFEERKREKEREERNKLREICNELYAGHNGFNRNYYLKYNKAEYDLLKQCLEIAEISAPKDILKKLKKLRRKVNQHKIYWKLENNFN